MRSRNITSYCKKKLKFSHVFVLIADDFRLKVPIIAKKGT